MTIRLAHVEAGESARSPVVVLHGFTGSSSAMADITARLSPSHHVIAPDLVGHGRSPAPPGLEAYRLEACVDQVCELLDRHGHDRAHLLGYSMGGRIGLAMACWQPERVRSAVLIGASAGLEDPDDRAARRASDEAFAAQIEADGVEAFVDRWMAQPLFATQARLSPERRDAARRQRLASSATGLANSLRGMGSGAQPPLHAALGSVDLPLRLVAGAEDPKFCATAEALAAVLPVADVVIIAEAGHAAHLEQPDAVAEAALEHFARADR